MVLEGEYSGKPMFVRRNESAKRLRGHKDYFHRIGVAIAFLRPNETGLPERDEAEVMDQIEDSLCKAFEEDQTSLQVLAITTNSMREFVFYSRDPVILQRLEAIQHSFPAYQLTSYVAEDRTWDLYQEFA